MSPSAVADLSDLAVSDGYVAPHPPPKGGSLKYEVSVDLSRKYFSWRLINQRRFVEDISPLAADYGRFLKAAKREMAKCILEAMSVATKIFASTTASIYLKTRVWGFD